MKVEENPILEDENNESVDNQQNQPMTIGYLNNFFHQQNDVFEKQNAKRADPLSSEGNLRTARDLQEVGERLITEDMQNQVQITKPNDDGDVYFVTN